MVLKMNNLYRNDVLGKLKTPPIQFNKPYYVYNKNIIHKKQLITNYAKNIL